MNNYAFLFIESQFDNLGDALINRELIKLMAEHAHVTLGVSMVPTEFRNMMGDHILSQFELDEKHRRSMFLLKILMRRLTGKNCYLFLSPGGWIGELDGRVNLPSWIHTFLYYVLALSGVKICQVGVSYEDLGPKLSLMLRLRSAAVYSHFVRDQQSKKVMENISVRVDGVCPDLAFNAFHSSNSGNPDGVTFSFRGNQYPEQLEDLKKVVRTFMKNYGAEAPVHFVYQVKRDKTTNIKLVEWFKTEFQNPVSCDDGSVTIAKTKELYSRTNVIVSNRLHSLLLAGSVGNEVIAAPINEHNKKIRALFTDAGLLNHVFENNVANDTVKNKNSSLDQAEILKQELQSHFETLFKEKRKNR